MISPAKDAEIRKLLDIGLPITRIAKTVGCHRRTVMARDGLVKKARKRKNQQDDSLSIVFTQVPKYYCVECAAWITVTPCPACLARNTKSRNC